MSDQPPYVVVVSGPSAGVGKSTLASNLAVYLKGLEEDLPVAYLPLDAKGNPDELFALGPPAQHSLADWDQVASFAGLLSFGQFGVDYCARIPVGHAAPKPDSLRSKLAGSDYPGVLILDVGAQSPFLRTALWAADLLLVPVKDPASLAEITALRREFKAGGGEDHQLWLLPSQLGTVRREQPHLELEAFLRFAADERGFQVLEEVFPAEALVREQAVAVGRAILTRAPGSRTHQQLHQLAERLLTQRQNQASFPVRLRRALRDGLLPARAGRIDFRCPLCSAPVWSQPAHYLEAVPSRKRLLVHQSCLALLLADSSAAIFQDVLHLMLLQPGEAVGGAAGELRLQVHDTAGEPLDSELFRPEPGSGWSRLLLAATGRQLTELYAEAILLSGPQTVPELLGEAWRQGFLQRRGQLKQLCRAGQL